MGAENILKQLVVFINDKLNKKQKIVLAVTLISLVTFISFLIIFDGGAQRGDDSYKVLFKSLSAKDSALVLQQLNKDNIPYRVDGNQIFVTKEDVYEQRIKLSAAGIPKDSTVGFELFDKDSFGSTNFEQRIKYLRAIEGELSRTIESLAPIKSATVHIAIPESTVFVAKEVAPSASVAIRVVPNMNLSFQQVTGIKNLIASGVPKLTVENIKVVDDLGQPLDSDNKASNADRLASMQMAYKQKFEKIYENKIIEILSHFVGGVDSVAAKVTIDFDFTSKKSTAENFNPNNVVRSEQLLEERKDGVKIQDKGGVPGAVSNIGPVQGVDSDKNKEEYSKTKSTTNYEISKVVSETENEFAKIIRINSAVVVDGIYDIAENEEGVSEITYEARGKSELKGIEDLVKRAVGFNDKRNDQVTVTNFRFSFPKLKKIKSKFDIVIDVLDSNRNLVKYLIAIVILFLAYKTVVSKFIDKMIESYVDDADKRTALVKLSDIESEEDSINQADELRKKIMGQLGEKEADEDKIRYEIMFNNIRDYLSNSSEEAGLLFGSLIREERG